MTTLLRGTRVALAITLASLSGCMLWMREPEFYAGELTELLESANEPIQACYDRHLAEQDAKTTGKLVVAFEVEAKTGRLTKIAVDSAHSDLPEPLIACVTESIAPLVLDPPDANTAQATFTWAFEPGPRKRPPPDPFASAEDTVLGCYATHLREVDREASGAVVVDYAFDLETGAVARLDLVADATTAPPPVSACVKLALEAARIAPDSLDDRNAAGRRTFTLRFTPYTGDG